MTEGVLGQRGLDIVVNPPFEYEHRVLGFHGNAIVDIHRSCLLHRFCSVSRGLDF